MQASGAIKPTKWDESVLNKIDGKLQTSKVSVIFEVTAPEDAGDRALVGEIATEYLMFYRDADKSDMHAMHAEYVGLSWFTGTLGGKEGAFVMEDNGTYADGVAASRLRILEGSGSGDLAGIAGNGKYVAGPKGNVLELEYQL